jgi:hypothetical protein
MSKFEKLLQKILAGSADRNIGFEDLRKLLLGFEFSERIKGSHHIYFKEGIEEIINIQPLEGKAKAYQVKQVRDIIIKYKLIK